MTAGLAADKHIIGHYVGRDARTLPIRAAKAADIRGPLFSSATDLAEPTVTMDLREGERCHHSRGDATLRMCTRMRRLTVHLNLPALRAHSADGQFRRRAAVDVEGLDRIAERGKIDITRTPQAALFAHREQNRQRWVGELSLQERGDHR